MSDSVNQPSPIIDNSDIQTTSLKKTSSKSPRKSASKTFLKSTSKNLEKSVPKSSLKSISKSPRKSASKHSQKSNPKNHLKSVSKTSLKSISKSPLKSVSKGSLKSTSKDIQKTALRSKISIVKKKMSNLGNLSINIITKCMSIFPSQQDIKKFFSLYTDFKKHNYSNDKFKNNDDYCKFLNTAVTLDELIKICNIANLKTEIDDNHGSLCLKLSRHAPFLMTPRRSLFIKTLLNWFSAFIILTFFYLIIINAYGYNDKTFTSALNNQSSFLGYFTNTIGLTKGIPTSLIYSLKAAFGLTIGYYLVDIINYFGFSFFSSISEGAKNTIREKVFTILGSDTRVNLEKKNTKE